LNYKFLSKAIKFEGLQRQEKDIYPPQAIREMLLNALVHRTYMGAPIQLRVFDNHISIWNEGNLPNGLTINDLKKEHNSRPRNPTIANACFMAGYIDTWGRGTIKIIGSCLESGLPEPLIIEKNGGIEVTILNNDQIGGPIGSPMGGPIGGPISNLSLRQLQIINLFIENPKITKQELSQRLTINESAIQKQIDTLKRLKVIERKGGTRGYWQVLKNKSK
jgi:ATP-dependent DNA helicase RecG